MQVANYLPSISSAIGGYAPQKYIWRICIALHAAPRFLFAFAYFGYYTSFHVGPRNTLYKNLARLCVLLHVLENTALVTLTYVSSTDNYGKFEKAKTKLKWILNILNMYCLLNNIYQESLYYMAKCIIGSVTI